MVNSEYVTEIMLKKCTFNFCYLTHYDSTSFIFDRHLVKLIINKSDITMSVMPSS